MKSLRFCCVRRRQLWVRHALSTVVIALAGTMAAAQASDKINVDGSGVILRGHDPVAYVEENRAIKGKSEIRSTYHGGSYFFASAANREKFDREPARYVPQYGGFCSYGVSLGVLGDTRDPQAFIVHDGKLYVCGNATSLKKFAEDIDDSIRKADKQWLRISKL